MTKIDISEWKPFAIGNIFDVIKGPYEIGRYPFYRIIVHEQWLHFIGG